MSALAGCVVSAFGSTDVAFEVVLGTGEVLLPATSNDRVAGAAPPSLGDLPLVVVPVLIDLDPSPIQRNSGCQSLSKCGG